ncbi:MAG: dihydropteroate synthase [spirochete symbiont of Stewartia floridana]|nr:MAG: dihydropteroate synthase [spirochete symbiont of Stewartia floridana]
MPDFHRPRIMGIINCTPDSFYAGSRSIGPSKIAETAESMIAQGADIIDIGGESTRPGSTGVTSEEQIGRVLPAIKMIRTMSPIDISIDTRNADVAEAAMKAGATIINDISALQSDSRMAGLAAKWDVPVILMHIQGTPATMQTNPSYADVVQEVKSALLRSAEFAQTRGIDRKHIILDPGIGFGKRLQDNLLLLKHLSELRKTGYPILVGLSRKSFLGFVLNKDDEDIAGQMISRNGRPPEDRLMGTIAAHTWCLSQGVGILRVHDVKAARDAITIWEAIECAS